MSRQLAPESVAQRLVIGADGGGTKTSVCLARLMPAGEFEIIGRGAGGSSNVAAVGLSTATTNLEAALDAAWQDAALKPCPVEWAVLALAGAGQKVVQEQIKQWADQRELSERIQIIHDAEAVLAAGIPQGWGVALVAGTGSVAMGRNLEGDCEISGGWGYWFGDEGSAYAIGQAALRAVSQAVDGRGPATQLTRTISSQLQVQEPRKLLATIVDRGDPRRVIAEVATEVTRAAEQGDEVAASIIAAAGKDLAVLIASTASRLSLGSEFPLALAGGALCGSELLRTVLIQELDEMNLCPSPIQLVSEPVLGCLRRACLELAD